MVNKEMDSTRGKIECIVVTTLGKCFYEYEAAPFCYFLGETETTREEFEEAMKNFMGTEDWKFDYSDDHPYDYCGEGYRETLTRLQEICMQ